MHTILVKKDGDRISKAVYFNSKFERELGEAVNYQDIRMNVGIIAESKDEAIMAMNIIIKNQNKITRKAAKKENNWIADLMKNDTEFNQLVKDHKEAVRNNW